MCAATRLIGCSSYAERSARRTHTTVEITCEVLSYADEAEFDVNHLEQLVSEWLQYNGYFVRVSVQVGARARGGFEGELDVVALNPVTQHLLHVECSLDALSAEKREERFVVNLSVVESTSRMHSRVSSCQRSWSKYWFCSLPAGTSGRSVGFGS